MILIPEIETVVILTPRAGSKSLKLAVEAAYPLSMLIYRHMEADGVPLGYDRWRKVGVVREPVARLWSLYKYLQTFAGKADGRGKWEPAYIEAQRRSASLPFERWIVENETVFTSPYDSSGGRYFPGFAVRHPLPETRKSQFLYLRPDLGTEVFQYSDLDRLANKLGVHLARHHETPAEAPPTIGAAATDHIRRFLAWDIEATASATRLAA